MAFSDGARLDWLDEPIPPLNRSPVRADSAAEATRRGSAIIPGTSPMLASVGRMATLTRQREPDEDTATFERRVRQLGDHLKILEAGCGRRWELQLDGLDYRLVGVDLNAESIRLRQETMNDLDEVIIGDLRTVPLDPEAYDVVFCSFVLEHVEDAQGVLDRLIATLRPGGLLLLRVPDRDGVYGWLARHTPHRSHIWYKRYIRGSKLAGTPGYGPFPVVYDQIVSWRELQRYCNANNLQILDAISSNDHLNHFPSGIRQVVDSSLHGIAKASGGRLTADHANLALVIAKGK